ncbi:MAG: GNAT family N-acetyltransferase [Lachnospiraceae bacterium]
MIQERYVTINGITCPVVISDCRITLLAASEAGRVIVGYLHPQGDQDLGPAEYLIECLESADDTYLERIVRRRYGLPWQIAETERLTIREFCTEDWSRIPQEPADRDADRIFTDAAMLTAYIGSQYRFYEYGIWAVVRKEDNVIVGKAGVADSDMRLELGFHIFVPFRNRGYASEACNAILAYVKEELDCPVYAKTETGNLASVRVLEKLGFTLMEERYNPQGQDWYQYVLSY